MSHVSFFGITLFFYFLGCLLFLLNLWDQKGSFPVKVSGPEEDDDLHGGRVPHGGRVLRRGHASLKRAADSTLPDSERLAAPEGVPDLLLPASQRLAFLVTGVGFLCHTAALLIRIQSEVPFSNLKEAISFFSWAMVLIFFLVELRYRIYVMGSFVLPMAFLSLISAATLPGNKPPIASTLKGALLGIHTTLSLLGLVAFAIAAVVGIMYLLQEKFLKSKQFSPLYDQLPPLDLLDQLNKTALLSGFPLFTLGMITGALWSQYALGSFWSSNNPKQILSILAWFFYLVALHGRMAIGWRARRAAHLAIAGFIGILFIFVTLV